MRSASSARPGCRHMRGQIRPGESVQHRRQRNQHLQQPHQRRAPRRRSVRSRICAESPSVISTGKRTLLNEFAPDDSCDPDKTNESDYGIHPLLWQDIIRVSMAGNLKDYSFTAFNDETVTGATKTKDDGSPAYWGVPSRKTSASPTPARSRLQASSPWPPTTCRASAA